MALTHTTNFFGICSIWFCLLCKCTHLLSWRDKRKYGGIRAILSTFTLFFVTIWEIKLHLLTFQKRNFWLRSRYWFLEKNRNCRFLGIFQRFCGCLSFFFFLCFVSHTNLLIMLFCLQKTYHMTAMSIKSFFN